MKSFNKSAHAFYAEKPSFLPAFGWLRRATAASAAFLCSCVRSDPRAIRMSDVLLCVGDVLPVSVSSLCPSPARLNFTSSFRFSKNLLMAAIAAVRYHSAGTTLDVGSSVGAGLQESSIADNAYMSGCFAQSDNQYNSYSIK